MIYNSDKQYVFVHIQKTGGVSITEALLQQAGSRFVSPAHLQISALRFSGSAPFVFAVVRSPWERLVSWFEMIKRKGVHNDFSRYLLEPAPGRSLVSFSEFIRRTAVIEETAEPECKWSGGDGLD